MPAQRSMRAFYCGRRSYSSMLALQQRLHKLRVEAIINKSATHIPDTVLAVEHSAPVYTIGRRDTSAGLTATNNVETVRIGRGGGITWHGPGQLTMYPIANIKQWCEASTQPHKNRSPIRWYSDVLEASMRSTIETFGLPSEVGCVGVWVPGVHGAPSRKVGSIGLQLSNWIAMHGIGLNVCNDLKYFDEVVMCEMPTKRATSIHEEMTARSLPRPLPTVVDVWQPLLKSFSSELHIDGLVVDEFRAEDWTDDALSAAVLPDA